MQIKFETLRAQDNWRNAALADEDKIGDQIIATVEIDGQSFSGQAATQEEAVTDLKERVAAHFRAEAHKLLLEIDKADGRYFFD